MGGVMNKERARQIIEVSREAYKGAPGIIRNSSGDRPNMETHKDGISITEENYIMKLMKNSRNNFDTALVLDCIAKGYSEWDILRGHARSGYMRVDCHRYPLVNVFENMNRDREGQYYIESPGGSIDQTCSFDSVDEAGAYYYIRAARSTYRKEQLLAYSPEQIIHLGQTVVHGHGV